MLFFITTPVSAEVYAVSGDTYTKNNEPSVNFGSASVVRVQNWANITTFARFDFSAGSETSVDIAMLRIPVSVVNKSGVIEIYQVLGSWSELNLTHSTRPTLASVPVAAFLVSGGDTGRTVSVDITPLVNQWLANPGSDFGLALVPTNVNLRANSKESGTGLSIETTALISTPTPANRFPQNGDSNVSTNPTLDLTCNSSTLVNSQFQISAQSGFSSIDYDSGNIADDICSHRAVAGLTDLSNYYWRGKQRLAGGAWSAWSTPTIFTVTDSILVAENLFQDEQLAYLGTRDADIRGSGTNPQNVIRNWNQGAQDVIRTGRRPVGSSTDEIYRTLLKFDVSALSSSASVVNAWVELTGWRHDDASHNQDVSVVNSAYALLKLWGEGNGIIESPLNGETSWLYTENPQLWTSPGASLASDTAANADRTAAAVITSRPRNLEGIKSVWTSRELLNLVKSWIDSPTQNNGLLFKANDETLRFMMNFASREHADITYRPKLIVESSEAVAVPQNTAPLVSAGTEFSTTTNTSRALSGVATDDGLPTPPGFLSVMWSMLDGPGTASFSDATNPVSQVSFEVAGVYTLEIQADDGALQSSDQVVVTVSQSSQQTVSTQQDSYTRSNTANVNYGNEPIVRIQSWGNMTGFIRFDLSSYAPGSSVASATLRVSVSEVRKSGTVNIRKVLGDWNELTLTENNKPARGAVSSSFSVSPADNGRNIEVDITLLFNQLLTNPGNDFGIALTPDNVNVWINSRENGAPAQILVVITGSPSNTAPQINSGIDQSVNLPNSANLSATVLDDGLPNPPGMTTVAWDVVSGPGTVNFGSPANRNSTASFTLPGDYVLRITASDSEFSSSDTVTVSVIDPNVNQSPTASAGDDFTVNINTTATLDGSVSDDGLPNPPASVSIVWTVFSGPGTASFTNSAEPMSDVSFDATGEYVLRLTADDNEIAHTDEVVVTVVDPTSQQTFTVVEDAYTRANLTTSNFGSEEIIRVQKWGNMTGFARFDLSSIPSGNTVSSATLRVSINDVKLAGSVDIHKVYDDWSELTLTNNNKPTFGPASANVSVAPSNNGQSVAIDITTLVNELLADPTNDYGIAISPNAVNLWIDSRESGSPMIVEIEL